MENTFEEIDLSKLLKILARKWWLVLAFMLVSLILSGAYTFFISNPVYQSDTSIYVGKEVDAQAAIAYNDLILAERLVNDYRELAKSRLVTGMVIEELGLDTTSDELARKIDVTSIKDTRLIRITAADANPEMAMNIANTTATAFREKVIDIMDVENVKVIDDAVKPSVPIKPNVKLNFAIAMILGVMMGILTIFIIEYFDKTIKNTEDVKNTVGLPVIGIIPDFQEEGNIMNS